jgi:hypothetical protein
MKVDNNGDIGEVYLGEDRLVVKPASTISKSVRMS